MSHTLLWFTPGSRISKEDRHYKSKRVYGKMGDILPYIYTELMRERIKTGSKMKKDNKGLL